MLFPAQFALAQLSYRVLRCSSVEVPSDFSFYGGPFLVVLNDLYSVHSAALSHGQCAAQGATCVGLSATILTLFL